MSTLVQLQQRKPGLLGTGIAARANQLARAVNEAAKAAATLATERTRDSFHYKRPANSQRRPGRDSPPGEFRSFLKWEAVDGDVRFDVVEADAHVPFWIVQEIGTGEHAVMRRGGAANPKGRPGSGATYARTVPSQRGRLIPYSLAWGTGPRGSYTAPGAATGQQLYLRSKLRKVPYGPQGRREQLHISREIHGQHFVRKGGLEGFREYENTVLAAARRAFSGQRRP